MGESIGGKPPSNVLKKGGGRERGEFNTQFSGFHDSRSRTYQSSILVISCRLLKQKKSMGFINYNISTSGVTINHVDTKL